MENIRQELADLAAKISNCRICDNQKVSVQHSLPMDRGRGRCGMVVGIQPGKVDVQNAEAFSGLAGRRLIQWFSDAGLGVDRQALFEKFYFTSLAKCASEVKNLRQLVHNCRPFLIRQIELLRPKVFITLGSEPLKHLFGASSFDPWVGRAISEQEIRPTLVPIFSPETRIFALPHPSPLSRWANSTENMARLSEGLRLIREFL